MVAKDSEIKSRGCIFSGVLGLTFLETLIMTFIVGSSAFDFITEPPLKLVPLIGYFDLRFLCLFPFMQI